MSPRERAVTCLAMAAVRFRLSAKAYRQAVTEQANALEAVGMALEALRETFGIEPPTAVAAALMNYGHVAARSALLAGIRVDAEGMRGLHVETGELEAVAGAISEVARMVESAKGDA